MNSLAPGKRLGWAILVALGVLAPAQAAAANGKRIAAIGVLAHDSGFASDHHEDGVDLNFEMQFAPLDFRGPPRPHLATLNFQGDTSVAYAGLGYRVIETPRWFADLFVSAAVHDGPLHKDPVGCELNSDCGYGVRVMSRPRRSPVAASPDRAALAYCAFN
jgi:hypothetical protein